MLGVAPIQLVALGVCFELREPNSPRIKVDDGNLLQGRANALQYDKIIYRGNKNFTCLVLLVKDENRQKLAKGASYKKNFIQTTNQISVM